MPRNKVLGLAFQPPVPHGYPKDMIVIWVRFYLDKVFALRLVMFLAVVVSL